MLESMVSGSNFGILNWDRYSREIEDKLIKREKILCAIILKAASHYIPSG